MKASILFLLVMALSFGAFAQNELQLKELPKLDFDKGWPKDSSLFQFSPKFQFTSQDRTFKFPNNNQINSPNLKKFMVLANKTSPFNMPVLYLKGNFRMPIYVPDSTVNYTIKEKRFGMPNAFNTYKK